MIIQEIIDNSAGVRTSSKVNSRQEFVLVGLRGKSQMLQGFARQMTNRVAILLVYVSTYNRETHDKQRVQSFRILQSLRNMETLFTMQKISYC